MKRTLIGILAGLISTLCMAQTFTDLANPIYEGKTKYMKMATVLDANFAEIETGAFTRATEFEVTFSTITNTLGTVILNTSSLIGTQADGDVYVILGRAKDTATNDTDYASMRFVITDNTTATENGQIVFQTTAGGTLVTGMTLGHNAGGTHALAIVPATDFAAAVTMTNLAIDAGATFTTPEATIDGKYGITGGDATTGLMVYGTNITSTSNTIQTNTYYRAFGAAPIIAVSYTEDAGGNEAPYTQNITATNFECVVVADKNFSAIFAGARP